MSLYPDSIRCPTCDLLPEEYAWNENARCKCGDASNGETTMTLEKIADELNRIADMIESDEFTHHAHELRCLADELKTKDEANAPKS